jgi:hypothetical protein
VWLNDRATLKGRTIFYNKKKIRISNSKVTNTKHIRFYYVLSAGKPSPTVPSDQGFYQSLWDSPDRSNRSLKRTAAQSQIALAPQAKKEAKPSSVSTANELTQSASNIYRPLSGIGISYGIFTPCSAILTQSYGKSIRQFWLIFA